MICFSLESRLTSFSRTAAHISLLCLCALPMTSAHATDADRQLPTGRLITSAAIASNPKTQKIYAVNQGTQSVTVVDVKAGANLIVRVGAGPIALAVNRRTNRIYVVNGDGESVSVIDREADK